MNKYYAGIGSRTISREVAERMTNVAKILSDNGYILRSGNAEGSDQAFALGAERAEIWLPWYGFNRDFIDHVENNLKRQHIYRLVGDHCSIGEPDDEAWDSIEKFHPSPKSLTLKGRKFMARNYRQVVGLGEPDSEFVICWTHDGTDVGGTGQAIRIANSKTIPVYNMLTVDIEKIIPLII